MATPHPNTVRFARGVLARLAIWPALRLAVHASWGGPASTEKQRWLAGVIVDQFEALIVAPPPSPSPSPAPGPASAALKTVGSGAEPPPDAVYVEELLLQIMADEFDVVLEDDSAAGVANDVVKLFGAICTGDETFVNELEARAGQVKGKMPKYEMGVESESGSDSGSESDWEEEDESTGEPVPQLLNRSERRTEDESHVDEDGFTLVRKKGRR